MRVASLHRSVCRLPRQYRIRAQNRAFSHTVRLSAAPRPPQDPSEPKNDSSIAAPRPEIRDATSSETDKPFYRQGQPNPGGRRSIRNGKTRQGIPPPPPLPEWFLRYNVRLHEDTVRAPGSKGTYKHLKLVDKETGHTVLRLPFLDPLEAGGSSVHALNAAPEPKFKTFFDQSPPAERQTSAEEKRALPKLDEGRASRMSEMFPKENRKRILHMLEEPGPDIWAKLQAQLLIHSAFGLAGPDTSSNISTSKTNLAFWTRDPNTHEELDRFVQDVADLVKADIIRLDANDIAELAGNYVGNGKDGPGSISAFAYDVYQGARATQGSMDKPEESNDLAERPDDVDEMESESPESEAPEFGAAFGGAFGNMADFGNIPDIRSFIRKNEKLLGQALGGKVVGVSLGMPMQEESAAQTTVKSGKEDHTTLDAWEELKLEALLDSLLAASAARHSMDITDVSDNFLRQQFTTRQDEKTEADEAGRAYDHIVQHGMSRIIADHLLQRIPPNNPIVPMVAEVVSGYETQPEAAAPRGPRTIVHIRDMNPIRDTSQGDAIIRRLTKVVQKRRKEGEQIVIVGTSTVSPMMGDRERDPEDEDNYRTHFRAIAYPTKPRSDAYGSHPRFESWPASSVSLANPGYRRLMEINLRNIQGMVQRLQIPCQQSIFDDATHRHLYLPGTAKIGDEALSASEVQKLVLLADGLRTLFTESTELEAIHISVAALLVEKINNSSRESRAFDPRSIASTIKVIDRQGEGAQKKKQGPKRPNLEQIRKNSTKHEQRLLSGVVDPQNIKTTFNDVHAPPETIEALKTLTTLSLMRPEAFSYGVLANDRLSGLLLYGPPGTGKTLLAKAVAKESQATVLEVSGAQVYEKYVGEGEKMVKAVFTLAKKLSPCVVFIDEADALFGSRSSAGNRTTHREIINQFLREWDGMDDHSVFMMVATNRPFDLDDAVLRRLPRRLLVDLPVLKDREAILGIHLKGEALDGAVSLGKLAEQTPLYSGSDLKNMCVAAALAAVREENELLSQNQEDKEFKLPDRRTLTPAHFDKAMAEISASINEDMSSLTAIKKFDEQFGDRRGRRKKSGYGFGGLTEADEGAARVRQDTTPKP